jgi:hypothetical protein
MLIAAGWNVDELGVVERSLTHFLGPIARVMVRRATVEARDFASLVNAVADCLTAPTDRASFLEQNARLAATGTGPPRGAQAVNDDATVMPGADDVRLAGEPGLSSNEIARATRLLVGYLGPLAQILVRRAAAQPGVSRATFLAGLADRLTSRERVRFLHDFEQTRSGPSREAHVAGDSAPAIAAVNDARPGGGLGPSPEEITRATRLLVDYLGPFAQILVDEAARRPGITRASFLANLADRLSGTEKERFLVDFERTR